MAELLFHKYVGTGNDFIIVDNRHKKWRPLENRSRWQNICARRTGVGADGLLFLEGESDSLRMVYLNADGKEAAMCGNGARCLAAYIVRDLQLYQEETFFAYQTKAGLVMASVSENVKIKMPSIRRANELELTELHSGESFFVDTGVPHALFEDLDEEDFVDRARVLAHHSLFADDGANISRFQKLKNGRFALRTFERGVEDETLSCGTAAVALAVYAKERLGYGQKIDIETKGGELSVEFDHDLKNVFLCGKVEKIYSGRMEI